MVEPTVLSTPDPQVIRAELEQLVLADLHGPLLGDDEEFAGENPIDRYPLGRLAPAGSVIKPELHDDLADAASGEYGDTDVEPDAPNVPSLNPSALGFTAHVDGSADALIVSAKWARYERGPSEKEDTAGKRMWQRIPEGGSVRLRLAEGDISPARPDPDQPDVVVRGRVRRQDRHWLVSLFLVNGMAEPDHTRHAPSWIFQVSLSAKGTDESGVFLARPEHTTAGLEDDRAEQRALAMAYRFHPEFAVGSGTAITATADPRDPLRALEITTATVPVHEIPATDIPNAKDDKDLVGLNEVVLDMAELARLSAESADAVIGGLRPLLTGYRAWIDAQRKSAGEANERLSDYGPQVDAALAAATVAADRIESGINLLRDDHARKAFGFANRAMYLQRLHTQVARARAGSRDPLEHFVTKVDAETTQRWRPFQLAFVLLNLPALADPHHPERTEDRDEAVADLLWFPTGGGKTEAYLGLTAFTLAIRRLQPALGGLDPSAGVAVLMRYTLRLLTIQQFERATTLICAAETLRREDTGTWGATPFRIGMWVGGRVTPNKTDAAAEWVKDTRRGRGRAGRGQGSPHQLTSCPWCGGALEPGTSIRVNTTYRRTLIICQDAYCPFGDGGLFGSSTTSEEERGLPVLVVDEEIYRHPPSLLIGTVDKFAQLPWHGPTATLFGRVERRCERHGYVTDDILATDWESTSHKAAADAPKANIVKANPLRPPDLIIQDELHLISGPLGSLVGLYESAVDRLASWHDPEVARLIRPKVIASTATVRRANHQIEALFARRTRVFPPPGLNVDDSFFARRRTSDVLPGRRYVGICAHGARIKSTLIRVYVSVLGAAQLLHERYGRNEVTDPYMTLVGYFNSLRDLGGMRRLVEDDVTARLTRADERGLAKRPKPLLKELTSRLSSEQIRPLLDQLAVPFPRVGKNGPIDVLLATNMIAVGVDVSRLGVMVVANQPKSTAEYIQATSRVGRQAPGLVFTVYNWARPRDLSHYERFEHFHATVYRHVEALSVTPFAERAIDRGLTGVLVALARELEPRYNGNLKAHDFDRDGKLADHVVRYLMRRTSGFDDAAMRLRVDTELERRLARWNRERQRPGRRLGYAQPPRTDDVAGLLLRPGLGPWDIMTCPTSLRDVEPGVQLQLEPLDSDSDIDHPFLPLTKPEAPEGSPS